MKLSLVERLEEAESSLVWKEGWAGGISSSGVSGLGKTGLVGSDAAEDDGLISGCVSLTGGACGQEGRVGI